MKKTLLSGAALLAIAVSAPAQAEGLSLDIGGHFKGYAAYNDFASGDERKADFRKDTEIHATGETTLDNGLTVGVHVELNVDGADGDAGVDESYAYLSGGWGRVNFGDEDGAAYLLQVAAPSADSNVDGLRQHISSVGSVPILGALDYDHAHAQDSTKFTYMTPVFNGFQAGVSYVPSVNVDVTVDSGDITGAAVSGYAGSVALPATPDFEDGWEAAARYEGVFEGVGVALGAGYSHYNAVDSDIADAKAWNVGVDLDYAGIGLGAAYLDEEVSDLVDVKTWVVGADYQLGAYKLGLTYLDKDIEGGEFDGTTVDADADFSRWTAGAAYSYGPGMTFRGSVSYIDEDVSGDDGYEVLVGTQINF